MKAIPFEYAYFPGGFPAVGLRAKTLPLHYRSDANLDTLAKRLKAWEASKGNDTFRPLNLHRTAPELAFELANVYIALRELFPSVMPESVSFSSHIGNATLAYAWQYASEFPHLRSYGVDPLDTEALDTLASELDSRSLTLLRKDMERAVSVADPYAAGSIDIGSLFSSERRYRSLLAYWRKRNAVLEAKGMPVRVPDIATSAAAFTLVHEFGHLLDAELLWNDPEASEHLYAALTYCITGEWPRSTRQWRNHLINYPVMHGAPRPPCPGTPESRRLVRSAHREDIMSLLTRYAVTSRDELFAEAFALTFCAADNERRERLEPFRQALREVGVLRRRPAH